MLSKADNEFLTQSDAGSKCFPDCLILVHHTQYFWIEVGKQRLQDIPIESFAGIDLVDDVAADNKIDAWLAVLVDQAFDHWQRCE